jgi:hypothetical protein
VRRPRVGTSPQVGGDDTVAQSEGEDDLGQVAVDRDDLAFADGPSSPVASLNSDDSVGGTDVDGWPSEEQPSRMMVASSAAR